MKRHAKISALLLVTLCTLALSGCWNYREINKLAIVTGFAIDKSPGSDKYCITVEIIDFMPSGKETKMKARLITSEGETVFDAVRSTLKTSGRRLFWSHAAIVIVSESIAKEGMTKVLDFIFHDAEMRTDMFLLVSKEETAKEILVQHAAVAVIPSYEIREMLESQKSLGESPQVKVYEYIGSISSGKSTAILPLIGLRSNLGQMTASLMGTAVFKNDKLIGSLDTHETKLLLFIINKFDKGIVIQDEDQQKISLEVFDSKTKVDPKLKNDKLAMNINIRIEAAIGETQASEDFSQPDKIDKLEKDASEALQNKMRELIDKVRNDYDADIFSFQKYIKASMPATWKDIEEDWDSVLISMPVKVEVKVKLKNSALASKPIKVGESK